jgi:hypothetical protein
VKVVGAVLSSVAIERILMSLRSFRTVHEEGNDTAWQVGGMMIVFGYGLEGFRQD